jgi:hypothetical protein
MPHRPFHQVYAELERLHSHYGQDGSRKEERVADHLVMLAQRLHTFFTSDALQSAQILRLHQTITGRLRRLSLEQEQVQDDDVWLLLAAMLGPAVSSYGSEIAEIEKTAKTG